LQEFGGKIKRKNRQEKKMKKKRKNILKFITQTFYHLSIKSHVLIVVLLFSLFGWLTAPLILPNRVQIVSILPMMDQQLWLNGSLNFLVKHGIRCCLLMMKKEVGREDSRLGICWRMRDRPRAQGCLKIMEKDEETREDDEEELASSAGCGCAGGTRRR
jgi:hypothetical protein